jgi:hypothetical protein
MMRWKKLFAATAGMATARPTAVATSASPMLLMTACGAICDDAGAATSRLRGLTERDRTPCTTPMTVPKRPMNGALLPSVPR